MRAMPSRRPRARTAAVTTLAVACSVAACAMPQGSSRLPRSEQEHGRWGERVLLEGHALPGVWLTRDLDGVARNAESEDGAGYAVRGAIGNRDQSIGMQYQGMRVDGGALDAHTLGLDVDVRTPLEDGTGVFFVRAGGGFGAGWLDARDDDELGSTGQAQLRLGLDLQPTPAFALGVAFGGIVFGHPGETDAYGTFVTVGATFVF
jgi:hypothetical protein